MVVEFSIIGGNLKIVKYVFIKEMLSPGSILKKLLNYNLEDGEKKRFMRIDKTREKDFVIIDFNYCDEVKVGEDYRDLIHELKGKLQGDVKGQLILSTFCYNQMTITLNLDSDDDEVKLIL